MIHSYQYVKLSWLRKQTGARKEERGVHSPLNVAHTTGSHQMPQQVAHTTSRNATATQLTNNGESQLTFQNHRLLLVMNQATLIVKLNSQMATSASTASPSLILKLKK